jgi:hypothetical protein
VQRHTHTSDAVHINYCFKYATRDTANHAKTNLLLHSPTTILNSTLDYLITRFNPVPTDSHRRVLLLVMNSTRAPTSFNENTQPSQWRIDCQPFICTVLSSPSERPSASHFDMIINHVIPQQSSTPLFAIRW